jgi:hypothetical protein
VVQAPGIVPRVRANENVRVPDLGVTCAPPSGEVMVPEPVLLVEILSPSNEAKTRTNIWAYCTIPSMREILAVRSTRMEVELLRKAVLGALGDKGRLGSYAFAELVENCLLLSGFDLRIGCLNVFYTRKLSPRLRLSGGSKLSISSASIVSTTTSWFHGISEIGKLAGGGDAAQTEPRKPVPTSTEAIQSMCL